MSVSESDQNIGELCGGKYYYNEDRKHVDLGPRTGCSARALKNRHGIDTGCNYSDCPAANSSMEQSLMDYSRRLIQPVTVNGVVKFGIDQDQDLE